MVELLLNGDRLRPSVLVTTYNHSKFISDSIESLLAQDFGVPEIIVVDDDSSDDTVAKARSFERFGVKVITKQNAGVSHSINLAIQQSCGEVLFLQSGDDTSCIDRISRQMDIIKSFDIDIVVSLPNLIDACSKPQSDALGSHFFRNVDISNSIQLFRSLFFDGNFICAPTAAIKRKVIADVGGFNEGLLQLQDYDFWLRAAARGHQFHMLLQRIVNYRVHANNLSSSQHSTRIARELIAVLRSVPRYASSDLIAKILYGEHMGVVHSNASFEILTALLFLRHRSSEVKQVGFEALIQAINDPISSRCLEIDFNLSRGVIFSLLDAQP